MNHQEQIQIEAMRELQKKIPLNDYGLPVGIYRADLLPFHDYEYEPDHEEASLPHLDAKQEVEQSTEKQSTADQWITADGETIDVPAGELDMEAL
ncbi:MAG: hypothetical protein GWN13_04260, partial [Phycisphaerae bacterium]|nr:hypothetical protein [Phycisphaerae bacterium]